MASNPPVVLIVHDHQESLAMYAYALLAMGFQPVVADNADDAFDRACSVHPDAIVADISRPGTSVLELARRFRSDARTLGAGIIVLAGQASGVMARSASEAGCDRLLVKPLLPDALGLEIRDVLAQRRRASTGHGPAGSLGAESDIGANICPHCHGALVFKKHHPVLVLRADVPNGTATLPARVRYEQAWVCRNGACNYREAASDGSRDS